jgi:hypothetical protein
MDHTPADGSSGVTIHLANDGTRVERTVDVIDSRKLSNFTDDVLGYAYVAGPAPTPIPVPGPPRYISRSIPDAYPDLVTPTGQRYVYAVAVQRAQGLGSRGVSSLGGPLYERMRCQVVYTSLTYKVLPDSHPAMVFSPEPGQPSPLAGLPDEATLNRYVTRRFQPTNRALTLPRALARWVLEDTDEGYQDPADSKQGPRTFEGLPVMEPGVVLEYTHHLRPDLPITRLLQAMGKVNRYRFDHIYDPGTLLCAPPDIQPVVTSVGELAYTVKFRFICIPGAQLLPALLPLPLRPGQRPGARLPAHHHGRQAHRPEGLPRNGF